MSKTPGYVEVGTLPIQYVYEIAKIKKQYDEDLQKTHEEEVIPYYSRFGNLICNMEICDRCNGSGTLPEFNYFQNGVCFKCCGEGFDPIKSNFED